MKSNFSSGKDALSANSSEAADDCGVSKASMQCCNAEGYGEMSSDAVETMASLLNLSMNPTSSFFDLGSGAGRLVLHMAVKGYAQSATGVELNTGRHALAVDLAQKVLPTDMPLTTAVLPMPSGGEGSSGVNLLQGDMLLANLSSASMLYMNPPCLPCEVRQALVQKLLKECHAEYVVTTLPLNDLLKTGEYIEESTKLLNPMTGYSWSIPITIYRHV